MTLSSIATVLLEDYLPDAYRKYNFWNFQQAPHYRSYNDNIPTYLQACPGHAILHCLDSGNKFSLEDIKDVDGQQGIFSVRLKDKTYTFSFWTNYEDKIPNCTCVDWCTHQIHCKHFFAVFQQTWFTTKETQNVVIGHDILMVLLSCNAYRIF